MGQYYKQAFKNNGTIYTCSRKVKGVDREMAKLMEHSWIGNYLMDSVAKYLYKNPTNLLWVGDYADGNDEVGEATNNDVAYTDVWGEEMKNEFEFELCKKFTYKGKFLVNHTKKQYLDFTTYIKNCEVKPYWSNRKMCINPISLLTVIGNGRGGGDYCGMNEDSVGYWKWDLISIEDEKPEGFEPLNVSFIEGE